MATAVSLSMPAEVIDEPGAKMSTHVPKFENEDRKSSTVVEPTVIASVTRARDWLHGSALWLPAETAYVTPSAMEVRSASSKAVDTLPPKLRLSTAGAPAAWFSVTQSRPAMTVESKPLPWQSSSSTVGRAVCSRFSDVRLRPCVFSACGSALRSGRLGSCRTASVAHPFLAVSSWSTATPASMPGTGNVSSTPNRLTAGIMTYGPATPVV